MRCSWNNFAQAYQDWIKTIIWFFLSCFVWACDRGGEQRREEKTSQGFQCIGYYTTAPQRETKGGCWTKKEEMCLRRRGWDDKKEGCGRGGGGTQEKKMIRMSPPPPPHIYLMWLRRAAVSFPPVIFSLGVVKKSLLQFYVTGCKEPSFRQHLRCCISHSSHLAAELPAPQYALSHDAFTPSFTSPRYLSSPPPPATVLKANL